jgi:hypothetical protein
MISSYLLAATRRTSARRTLVLGVISGALAGVLPASAALAQEPGSLTGRVVDAATQAPLGAASVTVAGLERGVLTSSAGTFGIFDVPAGSYVVRVSQMGYAPVTLTDVLVSPGRGSQVVAELRVQAVDVEGIVVNAGHFRLDQAQPVSGSRLNREEIRRDPGSVGDVSRVLTALPSMAHASDNANDLYVRGGSPFENAFFVDHIQVPNINHFPAMGSTGGAIGLLNVDLIEDVRFSAGGFSGTYGSGLSSVVDIQLREGSRDKLESRMEASFMGFGGTIEGPLDGGDGAWLISGRNSFLDVLVDALGSSGVAPRYRDFQAKATWDATPRDRLGVLALGGTSRISFSPAEARDEGYTAFGDQDASQATVGSTWARLWGDRGYSVLAVSASGVWNDRRELNVVSGDTMFFGDFSEQALRVRNIHRLIVGEASSLTVGFDVEVETSESSYVTGAFEDRLGTVVPRREALQRWDDTHLGGFAGYTWQVTPRLQATSDLRVDRWGASGRLALSPRFAYTLALSDRFALSGAVGLYRQRLPSFLLAQDAAFEALAEPRALHLVGGMSYLLTPTTRLTVEAYLKEYSRFPLEVEDPTLFVVDDGASQIGFRPYRTLVDEGRATSRGLEVLVQKKLTESLYGLASGSWFRSRYRDLDGRWRNRAWDNRWVATAVGGYRFSHAWEISGRWSAAGGAPYTPFDLVASTELNSGVIDPSQLNSVRHAAYHSLNLRVDHRTVLRGSTITTFLSLWNVYNRENVSQVYWNEAEVRPAAINQWGLFPVIGMEWRF